MPEAVQTSSGSWWKDILGSVDAIAATYKNVSDAIDANSSTRRESAVTPTPAATVAPVTAQDNTMKYIIIGGVVIAAIVGIALIARR